MSFLKNPNFEAGMEGWKKINRPDEVSWNVEADTRAMSGTKLSTITTKIDGGSFGQDVPLQLTSVSCIAFVRSASPQPVEGLLAIWNLEYNPARQAITKFTANENSWQQVVSMIDLKTKNPPHFQTIRVEIYVGTVNATLLVDCVNLF